VKSRSADLTATYAQQSELAAGLLYCNEYCLAARFEQMQHQMQRRLATEVCVLYVETLLQGHWQEN
jgi:heterodisulfide reductase subunit A-like polyferredoxin